SGQTSGGGNRKTGRPQSSRDRRPSIQARAAGRSVGVARPQHGVERRGLFLAATTLARLLVVALGPGAANDVLAVELLLHPAQGAVDGLVFADFDLNGHVGNEDGW